MHGTMLCIKLMAFQILTHFQSKINEISLFVPLILLVVRNTKVDYKGASACINRHINHGMDAALILMELH